MEPNIIATVDKASATVHGTSVSRERSLVVVDAAQTRIKSNATSTEHVANKINISVEFTSSCMAHSSKIMATKIMQMEIICSKVQQN